MDLLAVRLIAHLQPVAAEGQLFVSPQGEDALLGRVKQLERYHPRIERSARIPCRK